jgi:hypothetical protein
LVTADLSTLGEPSRYWNVDTFVHLPPEHLFGVVM